MKKIKVYSKEGGVKVLKPGITLSDYRKHCPSAIKVTVPLEKTLEKWNNEGYCKAVDGCRVEPDGVCSHGYNSWLIELGYI